MLLCWGWFLRDELRGPEPTDAEPPPPSWQPVAQQVSDDEDPSGAAYQPHLPSLTQR